MGESLAYEYGDDTREELIGGNVVMMSPSPNVNHNRVISNVKTILDANLADENCEAFFDGVDVYLDEENVFIPDAMIVCDPGKIRLDGIHGAPDLVVEVLSAATEARDRTIKKEVYGRCGVREYWLVDPANYSMEIYRQDQGALELVAAYVLTEVNAKTGSPGDSSASGQWFQSIMFPGRDIALVDVFRRVMPQ